MKFRKDWKLLSDLKEVATHNLYIAQFLPQLKTLFRRTLAWLAVCEVALVLQVVPTKLFIDGLNAHRSLRYLLSISFVILVQYGCGILLHAKMDNKRNEFRMLLRAVLWAEAHRVELQLSTDWHTEHGTGEKESIIEKNMSDVNELADSTCFQGLPIGSRILVTSAAMFFIRWQLGVLALVTLLCYFLVGLKNEKYLRPMRKEYWEEEQDLRRSASELTQNWRPIRSYGIEDDFSLKNLSKLLWAWGSETDRHKRWRRRMVEYDSVVTTSRATLFALSAILFSQGNMSIGLIVLSMAWMERTYSNYYNLTDFQHNFQKGLEAGKKLVEIYRTIPTVRQHESPVWPETLYGSVEFRNVSFRYPRTDKEALSDINLKIPANSVVAIMGYSGSGKTTLASLLERQYDPTTGAIYIDGIDLRQLDFKRYRQSISTVHQHPQLFDDTVSSNIRCSRTTAETGEEAVAATQAYAHTFIEELAGQYAALIGENGVLLSGGQRQRLSIARALHRKPLILILDEATSALDPESQRQLQNAIDELIARRESTIFIIAHRFSTIMNADIVVMLNKEGRIEEMGTHEELARLNGCYERFRHLEMSGALS